MRRRVVVGKPHQARQCVLPMEQQPTPALPRRTTERADLEYRIAAIRPADLHAAARFLFAAFTSDPTFADLYGMTDQQLVGTLPIFQGICRTLPARLGTTLGCYRGNELVGVLTYCPKLQETLRQQALSHPFLTLLGLTRIAWIQLRYRPRLGRASRARWRAYSALGAAQSPKEPSLQILALGVARSARGSGVARRLVAAVEADQRWGTGVKHLQVETWHATKLPFYERLGFQTVRHGTRDGVECWTLVRPIGT